MDSFQNIPESALRRTEDHSLMFMFEANIELEEKLSNKSLPTRIDTFVELDGGFQAPVKMLLPPNLDEEMKYPLLVYVYGGPGSQVRQSCSESVWIVCMADGVRQLVCWVGRIPGHQQECHLCQY